MARIDHLYASARGVSRAAQDRLVRRQRIADGMNQLRRAVPERFESLRAHLRDYDAHLERFGLRDQDIDQRVTGSLAVRFGIREGLFALLLVPLATMTLALFAIPYWLTGRIGRRATDLPSHATWQVVGGLITYASWIAGLSIYASTKLGTETALAVAGGLTVLSFVGLAALERKASVLRIVRAVLALRQTPLQARARLKRQKAALALVLEQVDSWLAATAPAASRDQRNP